MVTNRRDRGIKLKGNRYVFFSFMSMKSNSEDSDSGTVCGIYITSGVPLMRVIII